jgi:peptidoglycan hydrolase CwlO-like protein
MFVAVPSRVTSDGKRRFDGASAWSAGLAWLGVMGPKSPGTRRAAAAAVSVLLVLSLAPVIARAQSSELTDAEATKDEADRLVAAAVADRDVIEAELLNTMERYHDLAAELATVGAGLDRLRERIARAGIEFNVANQAAADTAVAAYMEALSMPSGLMLRSGSLEEMMVAQRTLQFLAGAEEEHAASLEVAERDLRKLNDQYQLDRTIVLSLQAGVEEEANQLQRLFAQADQVVAAAITDALAADASYREALDQVERARAAEEEQQRQEERQSTTTSAAPATSTTVAVGDPTTTPSVPPKPLKPAVEQWRSLVARFFSPDLVDPALRVMQCESLGDPQAYNPYSGASGLFQFLPGTWAVTAGRAGYAGSSPFEPDANVAAAAWLAGYYQGRGQSPWAPWHCKP